MQTKKLYFKLFSIFHFVFPNKTISKNIKRGSSLQSWQLPYNSYISYIGHFLPYIPIWFIFSGLVTWYRLHLADLWRVTSPLKDWTAHIAYGPMKRWEIIPFLAWRLFKQLVLVSGFNFDISETWRWNLPKGLTPCPVWTLRTSHSRWSYNRG